MNNKFIALIIVIIIAVCGVSAFLLTQNTTTNTDITNKNTTNNSSTNNSNKNITMKFTDFKGKTDSNNITAALNGPISSSEGSDITLILKITNNGNESISNVQSSFQGGINDFGTINPGESKEFKTTTNVPTLEDLKKDFGDDATISNPYFIGGFSVSYELNGENFQFNTNSLKIKLL